MTANDAERAHRLDRHFDVLLRRGEDGRRETEDGGRESLDADTVATLRYLSTLASRPALDSAFVRRLSEELMGSEAVLSHRVIPPPRVIPHHSVILSASEESRLIGNRVDLQTRSFCTFPQDDSEWWRDDTVGSQNDTRFVHDSLPLSSRNGYLEHPDSLPRPLSRSWWQRWELAAAILVIVVLGGYLALANLGRTISPPSRLSAITAQTEGTVPVKLRIPWIGVDAPIEAVQAFPNDLATPRAGNVWATGWRDGATVLMPEPRGPTTVAWLQDSEALAERGNVVLYGYADYRQSKGAVFHNLGNLHAGEQLDIIGENNEAFTYAVDWIQRFPNVVDGDDQRNILGPTDNASVTLITPAGDLDEETGRYPEVLVVRATRVTNSRELIEGQPWRLRSEAIHLDALIEPRQPPTGDDLHRVGDQLIPEYVLDAEWILVQPGNAPSVISWRTDSATIGQGSNVVLEGHRNVSGTEPAVFRSLNALRPGTRLELYSSSRTVATYEVEWIGQYPAAVSPEQRQEILGPSETESLTLITDAGELDRATGTYPDILVVRARFIGSAPLPFLDRPNGAECTIEPRSVPEISAAAATVLPEPRRRPDPTPLEGEPADAATITAVIAAERELVACLNANDPLRAYALYTDEGLEWLLDYTFPANTPNDPFLEWDPDFSLLSVPATPLPEAYQLALLSVDSVRILPDGRVAATATIESGGPGMLGVPTGIPVVHVFKPGDRYLIDEFSVPLLMGTPTP